MSTLAQRRVLLTRTAEDCEAWARELRALDARPVIFPCIECLANQASDLGVRMADALADADWLVFTSRRGVAAFAARGGAVPQRVRVAAIGPATAEAAARLIGRVDLTSPAGTAASLAAALAARCPTAGSASFVLALAANADDTLERALGDLGARCARFDVYRTVAAAPAAPKLRLSELGADIIFLASPSAATGLWHRVTFDVSPSIVTIGPATTAAVRGLGLTVAAEAREPSLQGMVEAARCTT